MSLGLLVMLALILPKRSNSRSALWQDPQIIREVDIEGVQRIEPNTVRSYLLVQEGDEFNAERIRPIAEEFFATGLFSDDNPQVGETLVVHVVENPIINRAHFEGNQRIEDKDAERPGEPAAARHLQHAQQGAAMCSAS